MTLPCLGSNIYSASQLHLMVMGRNRELKICPLHKAPPPTNKRQGLAKANSTSPKQHHTHLHAPTIKQDQTSPTPVPSTSHPN